MGETNKDGRRPLIAIVRNEKTTQDPQKNYLKDGVIASDIARTTNVEVLSRNNELCKKKRRKRKNQSILSNLPIDIVNLLKFV